MLKWRAQRRTGIPAASQLSVPSAYSLPSRPAWAAGRADRLVAADRVFSLLMVCLPC